MPIKKEKLPEPKKAVKKESPKAVLMPAKPATPVEPDLPGESNVAKAERMLNEFMTRDEFKGSAEQMLTDIRKWLYGNCQVKLEGDAKSSLFAENIRMGVDVPAACIAAARLEYLLNNLASGNYSRSVWEKAKKEEMILRKQMGFKEG